MKTGTFQEKETMQQRAGMERHQTGEQARPEQPEQTPAAGLTPLAFPEIKPLKADFDKAAEKQQQKEQNEQEKQQQRRRGRGANFVRPSN